MLGLRICVFALSTLSMGGCVIEKIADGGPAMTGSIKVPARGVAVYANASDVPGRYTVVEEVWVKDDGESLPKVLERDLQEMAGARGANALILAPTNRELKGTRVDTGFRFDNPSDYFAGTAIWVGEGGPPVKIIRH